MGGAGGTRAQPGTTQASPATSGIGPANINIPQQTMGGSPMGQNLGLGGGGVMGTPDPVGNMGMLGNASQVPQRPSWGQQMASAGYSMPSYITQAMDMAQRAQAPDTGTMQPQANMPRLNASGQPWDSTQEPQQMTPTRLNQWGQPEVAWGSLDSQGRVLVDPHAEVKRSFADFMRRQGANATDENRQIAYMLGAGPKVGP